MSDHTIYPTSQPVLRARAAPPRPAVAKKRARAAAFDSSPQLPAPPKRQATVALPALSPEQEEAVAAIVHGRDNVFLTGSAGTGKTFVLRHALAQLPPTCALVATTGLAATTLGGTTLHAWAGIGLGQGLPQQLLAMVEANRDAKQRWLDAHVLVCDEIR